ncbi:hypothetical protein [Amycolatopsis sp. NPDC049868]|uniref:hypothetical protein n=1 Tax=Amycolatopsis sp. NPDC049868 TaxID=3363934 RepID=UPI0037B69D33
MAGADCDSLTSVERALIEHVERGKLLDFACEQPVDEGAMRAWDDSRTVRAWVLRDIMRGRLAPDPDPHGLRLRGVRIVGRVDLENITSTVWLELYDCLLEDGLVACDARVAGLVLSGCRLEHPTRPPLNAHNLATSRVDVRRAVVTGHSARGVVNLANAHIGGLDCTGATLRNDSGPALNGEHLQVDQSVFLDRGFEASGTGKRGTVRLFGAHLGGLDCTGATLHNDSGPALHGEHLQVDQSVYLRGKFKATGAGQHGAICLLGARFGGQLSCFGATLYNDSGPAFHGEHLQVDRGMVLREGFYATGAGELGAVRLLNAVLGGLNCAGATLRNDSGPALLATRLQVNGPMFLDDGFEATGAGVVAVSLNEVRVDGRLVFDPAWLEHVTNPRMRLSVDRLVYVGLPEGISTDSWLCLLRKGTPKYAAQPYQQLASAHRVAGHDSQARRIQIEQRRAQIHRRALTGRAERTWARVTGLTLGYGYQPWRALVGLLAVITAAAILTAILGAHGGLAQVPRSPTFAPIGCTLVERIGVGLDLGTPLITSGARAHCDATDTATGQILTIIGWTLRLLAWAFATLFIAGFTGAVRKS